MKAIKLMDEMKKTFTRKVPKAYISLMCLVTSSKQIHVIGVFRDITDIIISCGNFQVDGWRGLNFHFPMGM
jgi:hypothetical protein